MAFQHEVSTGVRLHEGGDERAPGGAITASLCGHWEHDGACRWPHSTTTEFADETLVVRTSFDAPAGDVAEVEDRIRAALSAGELRGPDGRLTRWDVVGR
jgi:hypothetical protein